jgi:acetolactate synthase regulatory subunit
LKTLSVWESVNVDLNRLVGYVEKFFRDRGLKVKQVYSERGVQMHVAVDGQNLSIEIVGNNQRFEVILEQEDKLRRYKLLGPALSLFFGGGFMLKSLKAQEFFEKLETEFWDYLNKVVDYLNTAKPHQEGDFRRESSLAP